MYVCTRADDEGPASLMYGRLSGQQHAGLCRVSLSVRLGINHHAGGREVGSQIVAASQNSVEGDFYMVECTTCLLKLLEAS
jgi:hypothetical protein